MAAAAQASAETCALNPYVTYDPAVMQTSNTRWSYVWLVAAAVTVVAVIAIAASAYIYTTLYFPLQIPLVSIILLAGGTSIYPICQHFVDNKEFYEAEAKIDSHMVKLMETPTVQDPQLHSVEARCKFFQSEKDRFKQRAEKHLEKVSQPNFSKVDLSDRKQVKEYCKQLKKREKARTDMGKAALSQLKAAYFLYLMENPYDSRNLGEFFSFNPLDATARLAAKSQGDKSAVELIRTSSRSYTTEDLLKKSLDQLKQEIFEGKRSFFS
jgi:hypothetical protein